MFAAGCDQPQVITVTVKPADDKAAEAAPAEASAASSAAGGYGNLIGTVKFDGAAPDLAALVRKGDTTKKDAAVCAVEGVADESLLVNAETKGIANVVVYLEKRPKDIKPDLAKPPTTPVIFDQKGCRFFPHMLTVQIGQPLLVKSNDPIAHNTHTYPARNEGFNQVIKPGDRTGVPCTYTRAENTPIEVRCDLHTWMRAYHFPIDHPYVAITDAEGKFRIEGIPAGKQTFKVWHEKGQLLERKLDVTIEADKDASHDLTYGKDRLAAAPVSGERAVAWSRLQQGGDLNFAQGEDNRP